MDSLGSRDIGKGLIFLGILCFIVAALDDACTGGLVWTLDGRSGAAAGVGGVWVSLASLAEVDSLGISWSASVKGSWSGVDIMTDLLSATTLVVASLSGWVAPDEVGRRFGVAGGSSRLKEVASLGPEAGTRAMEGGEPSMRYSR